MYVLSSFTVWCSQILPFNLLILDLTFDLNFSTMTAQRILQVLITTQLLVAGVLNICNMLKNDLGIQTEEQSQCESKGFLTELCSLRRKLEQEQERNKRWADEKCEWVQQRAKLCYRIDKLKCDLSKKHELKLKEELQKANLGPIQDEMLLQVKVAILEAEKEKVAEKESEPEKLKLDKQNHVLQQKHLQIRLMQLEEQLLQKDRELQELKKKQEGWKKRRREREETENKWDRFKSIFRKRKASNEDSSEKEQQTGHCPLLRLLLSWRRSTTSEQLIWLAPADLLP